VDQVKRLKQLEIENGRLKKLVVDLSLEKQVLLCPGFRRIAKSSSDRND